MLKAIQLINEAKSKSSDIASLKEPVLVDLHPARPDFRGMKIGSEVYSLEEDPTFQEIENAGARVEKNDTPHNVLGDMFLISGEIPRVTDYETGVKHGLRFDKGSGQWNEDELIMDERFLACKLKG